MATIGRARAMAMIGPLKFSGFLAWPSNRRNAILAWVSMTGSIASKAACQAGGFFLQRADFLNVVMGNDLQ
jgi:hypothetical protein